MLGERLAEIRKNYHDTQKSLADKLGLTVWAVSAWEQGRNSPPSDVLLAICKLYGTSADYLLGLTDIDPSDEARKQRQRLTEEEQNEMHRYEEYLLSQPHIIKSLVNNGGGTHGKHTAKFRNNIVLNTLI